MQNKSRKSVEEVLERNEDFFVYKIIDLISPLNLHFSKGVSPWFFWKNWRFSNYCFYAIWIVKKWLVKD